MDIERTHWDIFGIPVAQYVPFEWYGYFQSIVKNDNSYFFLSFYFYLILWKFIYRYKHCWIRPIIKDDRIESR